MVAMWVTGVLVGWVTAACGMALVMARAIELRDRPVVVAVGVGTSPA